MIGAIVLLIRAGAPFPLSGRAKGVPSCEGAAGAGEPRKPAVSSGRPSGGGTQTPGSRGGQSGNGDTREWATGNRLQSYVRSAVQGVGSGIFRLGHYGAMRFDNISVSYSFTTVHIDARMTYSVSSENMGDSPDLIAARIKEEMNDCLSAAKSALEKAAVRGIEEVRRKYRNYDGNIAVKTEVKIEARG